ncbi:hornerin-like isoform x1 [Limosa lapponica baueri]|uniref:Hornerin-like isoform x1 n=1 Tax=Limosa lapponica baueri TaxID=1758121 RepID=A0A2I0UQ57_LIMLA|nr:hornerin-like isoform x1 [Limosa lapponica baueri]
MKHQILGFPQTNTSIDCDSLLPNYEAEPQTSVPPYLIAVSFDNFEPGNEIQVTLEALKGVGFKGFNLQAREIEGDVPVGTFKITDPNTKGLECHNVTLMIEVECSKVGPSGSSQSSYSGSQGGGVVYTISRNGCGPVVVIANSNPFPPVVSSFSPQHSEF